MKSLTFLVSGSFSTLIYSTTEETKVEGKKKEFVCPLRWSVHHNMARDGYIESTCCCVQARFLGLEKNTLCLVMVYAILFNNVFIAFSSFKNKYVAEIQLAVNDIWLLSLP